MKSTVESTSPNSKAEKTPKIEKSDQRAINKKPAKAPKHEKGDPQPSQRARNNDLPDGPTEGMTLQQKIEGFRKLIVQQRARSNTSELPDAKKLLRRWFTDTEMSALWARLKRFMASKAAPATKAEWAAIDKRQHREGKGDAKNNALMLSLAMPETWEQRWVSECTKVSETKEKAETRTQYHRGELEQIHGVQEAADFIAKGKYIEGEDSDGDVVYTKKQKTETEKKTHTTEAETKSTSRCTSQVQDQLLEKFEAWFSSGAVLDRGQGINKRPAAAIEDKKGKRAKTAAQLVAQGDAADEVGQGQGDKNVKTPLEDAQSKATKMASTMSTTSAKMMSVIALTKKDNITAPLLSSMQENRKLLDSKRSHLLQLSCSPKSNVKELKDATVVAAKIVADAEDLKQIGKTIHCTERQGGQGAQKGRGGQGAQKGRAGRRDFSHCCCMSSHGSWVCSFARRAKIFESLLLHA